MIAHGVRHGKSLAGTAGWFSSIGFSRPDLQARASAVVEIGAGTALLVGAATPLAAAAVVGTMAVAAQSVHRGNGYFITDEGWEYVGFISASAIALAALGGGRFSLDALLGLDVRGGSRTRALLAAAVGVGAAAAQLKLFWTRPPNEKDRNA